MIDSLVRSNFCSQSVESIHPSVRQPTNIDQQCFLETQTQPKKKPILLDGYSYCFYPKTHPSSILLLPKNPSQHPEPEQQRSSAAVVLVVAAASCPQTTHTHLTSNTLLLYSIIDSHHPNRTRRGFGYYYSSSYEIPFRVKKKGSPLSFYRSINRFVLRSRGGQAPPSRSGFQPKGHGTEPNRTEDGTRNGTGHRPIHFETDRIIHRPIQKQGAMPASL